MMILCYICFIIGLIVLSGGISDLKTFNNTKTPNNLKLTTTKDKKGATIMLLIGVVLLIMGVVFAANSGGTGGSKSKYQSLTKEEKAWYQRNYGNGKSEQYTKAIEDYKKTH